MLKGCDTNVISRSLYLKWVRGEKTIINRKTPSKYLFPSMLQWHSAFSDPSPVQCLKTQLCLTLSLLVPPWKCQVVLQSKWIYSSSMGLHV